MEKQRSNFISFDAIPREELGYLPTLSEDPRERAIKTAREFLTYLAKGKATGEEIEECLKDLEAANITRKEALALAIAAYEHASTLGLTDVQRGTWFYNLMILGCDPRAVKQAIQTAYDLRAQGLASTPQMLAQIVAEHFATRYLP